MSKFKVGDKVKVVRKDEEGCFWNINGKMDKCIGEIGEILQISHLKPNIFQVKLENPSLNNGGYFWNFNEYCLELVDDKITKKLSDREIMQALLDGETITNGDYELSLDINTGDCCSINKNPSLGYINLFSKDHNFTIKEKTININGFDVPEPCKKELEFNTCYYLPAIDDTQKLYRESSWRDVLINRSHLKLGLVHLTKEAAIQHARALLSFAETKK